LLNALAAEQVYPFLCDELRLAIAHGGDV
jgi:hypothetical protein